jgi:hypothetical protein
MQSTEMRTGDNTSVLAIWREGDVGKMAEEAVMARYKLVQEPTGSLGPAEWHHLRLQVGNPKKQGLVNRRIG